MAISVFPEKCYYFLKARNGLLEPWRWSKAIKYDMPRHVVVLNEDTPKSITLDPTPDYATIHHRVNTYYHGGYEVIVVNRGAPVTLYSGDDDPLFGTDPFPHTMRANDSVVIKEYMMALVSLDSTEIDHDALFFRVDHFDMTPRVLSDHIHSDNDRLHGIIAFSCDWPDTRTVELWVDGETKLAKFQNIGSGEHVLEYSIPGPVVKGWSREGTRMVQLELRTTCKGHERILWSGATLAVKSAVPQG